VNTEMRGINPNLRVQTLGGFRVWRAEVEIPAGAWGRQKALHLCQFLITFRRQAIHKEAIIDRLWPTVDLETGNRDFKVALNAVNRTLEPERRAREVPLYIQRFDLTYQLNPDLIEFDTDRFETAAAAGNRLARTDPQAAIGHFEEAADLYTGDFLPERRYEDWTALERERLQTLALITMTQLAELHLASLPHESIRLSQEILKYDPAWESAYRAQMRAYLSLGNRPQALRIYEQCRQVLAAEFGVPPLPETEAVLTKIKTLGTGETGP
jgi:DNA-binding SARP family transcriptional activator